MTLRREDVYRFVGRRVRELREANGLSQAQLGAILDPPLTRATVSRFERGTIGIPLHSLVQVACNFCVPAGSLLGDGPYEPRERARRGGG